MSTPNPPRPPDDLREATASARADAGNTNARKPMLVVLGRGAVIALLAWLIWEAAMDLLGYPTVIPQIR